MTPSCTRRLATLALFACALPALAQQSAYPSKPVKVVVGYAPGGAVDAVARTINQALQA